MSASASRQIGTEESELFDARFRHGLHALLRWRRDTRRFQPGAPLDPALLRELLELAVLSPSVGNAQPWRFVSVDEGARRGQVTAIFERENARAALGYADEKQGRYRSLKLAGLREAPVHLAVFCDPGHARGAGLGRQTMPEMLQYSVVCAIHTLWLAARARGVALGWVSILDPKAVSAALDVPAEWGLIAYLCLGWPEEHSDTPDLERQGWEPRAPLAEFLLQR